jgi:proteasome lid subunit RPN8/RPN11
MHWLKKFLGFPDVREVAIVQSVLDDLSQMAIDAHPNEMLAFFAASKKPRDGLLIIDEIHLQAYDASEDSASVFLHNLPMTTGIVGTAHSHPGGSTRPSDEDRHLWDKFGFVHAIIPEPYTAQSIVFFRKDGRRIRPRITERQR